MGQKKSQKGTVVVFADNGCLRLRWRFQGQRKSMSIGLPDTKANRPYENYAGCIESKPRLSDFLNS